MHGGTAHNAPAANFLALGLKLRLDERDDPRATAQSSINRRQDFCQRDEGNIHGGKSRCSGKIARLKIAGIYLLQHNHPWILPELPVQLSFADVHREHFGGPVLKQAVGKSTRGGAHIQTDFTPNIQGKNFEGFFQFFAAAANEPIRRGDSKNNPCRKFLARFKCRLAIRAHRSSQDQALGLGAAFHQIPRYQQLVQPLAWVFHAGNEYG